MPFIAPAKKPEKKIEQEIAPRGMNKTEVKIRLSMLRDKLAALKMHGKVWILQQLDAILALI